MNALLNVKTPDVGTGEQSKLPATDQTEFVTANDLIRFVPMGRGALRARMKDGTIPFIRLGERIYHFHLPSVRESLIRRQQGGAA